MITITYKDQGNKGRYVAHVDGHDGTGELTISKLSDTTLIADHTGTDDSLRGMGVAKALVERLVADARAAGQKIVPLCPYVRAQAQKHGDAWADVIQR